MPAIIIEISPDGATRINAMPSAPPELMQDAQDAESLEDALMVAKEVLGGKEQDAMADGDAAAEGGEPHEQGEEGEESMESQEDIASPPQAGTNAAPDEASAMQQGYASARKRRM